MFLLVYGEMKWCYRQDLNIGKLLGVESTRNLNDVVLGIENEEQTEFMREIGWTDEAEMAAEYASQHIMYPFTK